MKKTTVYIPIEIKAREFASQVLLATRVAESGARVYLGGKRALLRAVSTKPEKAGILLYKSGWHGGGFSRLKNSVSRIAVLDQEMSPAWPEMLPAARFDDLELDFVDRLYYVNQAFAKSLLSGKPGVPKSKVKAFGWPRVDLWTSRYAHTWEAEEKKIRKKFGDFVLFSSDFGILDQSELEWRTSRKKEDGSWARAYANFDDVERDHLHRLEEYGKVVDFLSQLDEDSDFPAVVVRPHPAEDHSIWKSSLQKMKKTSLAFEGDITPWLLAAKALLHSGSTTAIQAVVAGKPVGFIGLDRQRPVLSGSVSREVSQQIRSVEEAFKLLQENPKGQESFHALGLIDNTAGNSAELISADLLSLDTPLEEPLLPFWLSKKWRRQTLLRLIALVRSRQSRELAREPVPKEITKSNLAGGISAKEVTALVLRLSASGAARVRVRQVSKNLVCIEGTIAQPAFLARINPRR